MRKILTIFLFFAILTGAFLYIGCKKSEETDEEYTLTVFLATGVEGTPAAGTQTYSKDEQVDYEYSLEEAYTNLRVTLDDVDVESSGVITITGNHTLQVYADPDPDAFALTVSVSNGVTGTPTAGTYHYFEGTQIDYDYTLQENYINLIVRLDAEEIENSGTITISQAHTLSAVATLHYDIQGTWTMEEQYDDESSFIVTVTFTGDSQGGTVVDSDGGIGTYTVTGVQVTFTLEFPTVAYEYTGLFTTKDLMSGSSNRIVSGGTTSPGTWTATRSLASSSATAVSQNNKGNYNK
jgi:hypothetical protein